MVLKILFFVGNTAFKTIKQKWLWKEWLSVPNSFQDLTFPHFVIKCSQFRIWLLLSVCLQMPRTIIWPVQENPWYVIEIFSRKSWSVKFVKFVFLRHMLYITYVYIHTLVSDVKADVSASSDDIYRVFLPQEISTASFKSWIGYIQWDCSNKMETLFIKPT